MKAYWHLLVLGLSLGAVAVARTDEPKLKSPELQVLDRLIGTWEETTVSKPALWNPEEKTTTATSTRRWILGGTMVENKGGWKPGNNEFLQLISFDAGIKEYRQWYFDNELATPMVSQGKWDEATKTLSIKGTLADGVQTASQQRFIDGEHFTWTFIAKDGAGKVVLNMEGKGVRKKP